MTWICCYCSFDAGADPVPGCCSGSGSYFYCCCFEMNMMTYCWRSTTCPSSSYSYPCHDGDCTRSKTKRMSFGFYCYYCSSDGWI